MGEAIDNPERLTIPLDSLKNIRDFIPLYDSKRDTFFLRPQKAKPATSFDWDGEFWIRLDPVTTEIVGLEIENFESVFLKRHPEVAKVWKQAKTACTKKPIKQCDEDVCESFIMIIIEFLSNIFRERPQQLCFSPV